MKPKVLLIGWDAADWKMIHPLLDKGMMPNLEKMINEGVMGNLETLDPPMSPTLWTSIATGKRPYKHGIHGFMEITPDGQEIRPAYITSRKVKAIWNILMQKGFKSHVVGWWPSHPAEPIDGVYLSNFYQKAKGNNRSEWPMLPNTVHPPSKAKLYEDMRIHPSEMPPEHLLPFVPKAKEIDQSNPNYLKRLKSINKITTDAANIQKATVHILQNEEWDFVATYFDAIDHYGHGFMRFNPPHRPHIPKDLYDYFNNVVTVGYQYHDMILGRLLELAGEETTVMLVSDHGFHPDHLRPKFLPKNEPAAPAMEHSAHGIIVAKGPGIKKDQSIFGASLLDITPTILPIFGLPVAKDMDGKVLVNLYEEMPKVELIDSWETVAGECGMHQQDMIEDPEVAQAALEQLVELGYIEKPSGDKKENVKRTKDYNQYFLARSYMDGSKFKEALPLLEELWSRHQDKAQYGIKLVHCSIQLGLFEKARLVMDAIMELTLTDTPDLYILEGQVRIGERKYRSALKAFKQAEQLDQEQVNPNVYLQIGRSYIALKQWGDAERVLRQAIAIHPKLPIAWHLLGVSLLNQKKPAAAVEACLEAIGLHYHFPLAHYYLGRALMNLRDYEAAASAFEVCLKFNATVNHARQSLMVIYQHHLKQPEKVQALQKAIQEQAKARGTITIVSGLPRSGTSMMMQMLDQGGMAIFTDKQRAADESNPKGYYEHDAVKNLAEDKRFLAHVEDKAVKIVANLLEHLPPAYHYKVVFMDRPIEEVMQSQHKMLVRLGKVEADTMPLNLALQFQKMREKAMKWAKARPNVSVLRVPYHAALKNPLKQAERIKTFLDMEHLDTTKMVAVVDRRLHREKVVVAKEARDK